MASRAEEAITRRLGDLPGGLREHLYRVERVALELARQHHVDEEKTRLGALAHDLARAMKGEELLARAHELGVTIHPVEAQVPILLHGPVAAELLRQEDGIEDEDIHEAVCWHSTARTGLGAPAKVVFLADKLDPQKISRYPFLGELRNMASSSLDRALLKFLDGELVSLLKMGSLVHPASIAARNELLLNDQ